MVVEEESSLGNQDRSGAGVISMAVRSSQKARCNLMTPVAVGFTRQSIAAVNRSAWPRLCRNCALLAVSIEVYYRICFGRECYDGRPFSLVRIPTPNILITHQSLAQKCRLDVIEAPIRRASPTHNCCFRHPMTQHPKRLLI